MSKLLDASSVPSTKSELDLFTVPPTQVAIRPSFWNEVQLQNPCTNEGPHEFKISPDMYMLDLSKNYVYFIARIVKPDGTDCKVAANNNKELEGDTVTTINMLGKTLFRQVKVFLNGKLTSDSGDKYAYRAVFETELNFGRDAKKSHLQASLYYPDGGVTDEGKMAGGYSDWAAFFKNSSWVGIMAPLHIDLFMQERFLINKYELRIKLYRNSDEFCLLRAENCPDLNYKLQIQHMSFFIKKVEVSDGISMAIESMLQTTSVKYPIRRTQITTMHLTENRRSTPLNSLFSGALPRRLVIGLTEAKAARGSYKANPFLFHKFGISDIKIISGMNVIPSTPYKLDFEKGQLIRAFVQLFEGLDMAGDDKGNTISIDRFRKGGCTFSVFELGADGTCDSSTWELIRDGTTSLEMNFKQDLPDGGLECIIYAEFDSLLMTDHTRQAYMDYTI